MANASYVKNEKFTDLIKFENQVWYGLQKVLGKDFCKTGYFKKYWDEVKKGKFIHQVGNVVINADAETGIRIEEVSGGTAPASETTDHVEQKPISAVADKPVVSAQLFGKVTETGKGTVCEVRFYHKQRQVGFLSTSKLHDETDEVGVEIAKQLGIKTLELFVTKNWESEVEVGAKSDYL